VLPASDDPVTVKLLEYDPFPWREIGDKKWARVGHASSDMVLAVTVETLRRPWVRAAAETIEGTSGYLYDIHMTARDRRFDYRRFLQGTKRIHPHVVHLCLDNSAQAVRLTVPAILGATAVIKILERVIEVAGYVVERGPVFDLEGKSAQRLSEEWPEYVLGPENPLTFLGPDMPCTFFAA
jgi:hypothetical protein